MTAFPRRYLVYIAGQGTSLYLRVIQEMTRRLGPRLERVDFVIGDLRSYRWAQSQPLDPRIHLVYQHEKIDPFPRPSRIDEKRLASFEERYGVPHLWRYISAHRMIDHLNNTEKLAYLQTYLEYFESLYHQYTPDVLITGAPDSMPFLLAVQVFKKNGAIPILLGLARMPGRLFIVDNELEQVYGLKEAYAHLKTRELTPEESASALKMRDSYRTHRIRPVYFWFGTRLRGVPSISRFLRMIRQYLFMEERFFEIGVGQMIRKSLVTRWRTPWQHWDARRYSHKEIGSAPFFYYPLHYEPESTIDMFSTYTRDQLQVIRWLSSALPAGYSLVVKEHPNMPPGARPLGYYRRLAQIPAVRLLPVHTDGYDIIQKSAGVATLAGTTGFEALCLGKPILLIGHAFYEVFQEAVFRPAGIEGIASCLQRMAHSPGLDDQLLEKFLAAVIQCTYAAELAQTKPEVEGPENIGALTDALLSQLTKRIEDRCGVEATLT